MLTASLRTRRRRLEMRMQEAPDQVAPDDLAVVRTPDLFLRMEEIMIWQIVDRYRGKIIDKTELTKPEVVEAIIAALPAKSSTRSGGCVQAARSSTFEK